MMPHCYEQRGHFSQRISPYTMSNQLLRLNCYRLTSLFTHHVVTLKNKYFRFEASFFSKVNRLNMKKCAVLAQFLFQNIYIQHSLRSQKLKVAFSYIIENNLYLLFRLNMCLVNINIKEGVAAGSMKLCMAHLELVNLDFSPAIPDIIRLSSPCGQVGLYLIDGTQLSDDFGDQLGPNAVFVRHKLGDLGLQLGITKSALVFRVFFLLFLFLSSSFWSLPSPSSAKFCHLSLSMNLRFPKNKTRIFKLIFDDNVYIHNIFILDYSIGNQRQIRIDEGISFSSIYMQSYISIKFLMVFDESCGFMINNFTKKSTHWHGTRFVNVSSL